MDDKLCIHWDSTKKRDKDINIISVSTSQASLLLAVSEIATSSSDEYVQDIKDTAHNDCLFNGIDDDAAVLHKLYQKFTCALMNRASSNALGLKKLQNHFGNLVQLFCHIHPLDTMASKTRSCQCPTTKEYKCFGSDARVVNLIAAISKLRYK